MQKDMLKDMKNTLKLKEWSSACKNFFESISNIVKGCLISVGILTLVSIAKKICQITPLSKKINNELFSEKIQTFCLGERFGISCRQ